MRPLLARITADRRGNTIIEFALIVPVMMLMLLGFSELLYQEYAQSILAGEVQKAGRDSGIEGGSASTATIDNLVLSRLGVVVKGLQNDCTQANAGTGPSWCSVRKSYDSFSEVAPEPFTDTNKNSVRDPGECFTDVNGNGVWDADPGNQGQGGASAVASYTMTISYRRLFPLATLAGWSNYQKLSASTLLKNQPYASQTTIDDTTVCT